MANYRSRRRKQPAGAQRDDRQSAGAGSTVASLILQNPFRGPLNELERIALPRRIRCFAAHDPHAAHVLFTAGSRKKDLQGRICRQSKRQCAENPPALTFSVVVSCSNDRCVESVPFTFKTSFIRTRTCLRRSDGLISSSDARRAFNFAKSMEFLEIAYRAQVAHVLAIFAG